MKIALYAAMLATVGSGLAATTIDPTDRFSYAANLGWMDWRGDTLNGAVMGEFVCSGNLYAANAGWVSLGSGAPTNGIRYMNLSANDFGVNRDTLGNLRGYAYGANFGWISFEDQGAPKVDLMTGRLTGYIYSANCGWISLSNSLAFVKTTVIGPGADTDGDGLADSWELLHFGNLGANGDGDADGDGMTNLQEYLADTDPTDPNSKLVITYFATPPDGTAATVTWQSVPTRLYRIDETFELGTPWFDSGLGLITPDGNSTTRITANPAASMRFYRVQAIKPPAP